MKHRNVTWMLATAVTATAAMSVVQPLQAELLEKTKKVGGTTVRYKVVLPNGYDPAKAYPGILALGGGPQTMNTVDNVLNRKDPAICNKTSIERNPAAGLQLTPRIPTLTSS